MKFIACDCNEIYIFLVPRGWTVFKTTPVPIQKFDIFNPTTSRAADNLFNLLHQTHIFNGHCSSQGSQQEF